MRPSNRIYLHPCHEIPITWHDMLCQFGDFFMISKHEIKYTGPISYPLAKSYCILKKIDVLTMSWHDMTRHNVIHHFYLRKLWFLSMLLHILVFLKFYSKKIIESLEKIDLDMTWHDMTGYSNIEAISMTLKHEILYAGVIVGPPT